MIDVITKVMVFMGVVTTIALIAAAIIVIVDIIKNSVAKAKWKYKRKHRFDKKPIAKCYCKDCVWWNGHGDCYKFNDWKTADDWFCWMAEPRKHDPEKECK